MSGETPNELREAVVMEMRQVRTLAEVQQVIANSLRRSSEQAIDLEASLGYAAEIIADLKASGIKLVRRKSA